MPSTYSPNLRIELIANGEQSGTWGTTTNTNLGTLIEDAISGYVSVSITSADQALTANNGSADQSRNMILNLTTTTTADFNVYIPPAEKFYVVRNTTAYNATIYCSTVLGNTTAAGTGVTILPTSTTIIFSDGTNVRVAIDSFSASSLVATSLTVNGNTTLGDSSSDTITLTGTVQPGVVISGSSSGNALRITQTGAGNALVVEDSANPDSTPFVIDASGKVLVATTTPKTTGVGSAAMQIFGGTAPLSFIREADSSTAINLEFAKARASGAILASGDTIGRLYFSGSDGTAQIPAAYIDAAVDGTPGTNDMPGRLVFSTTADGASSPTERMRIDSAGNLGLGVTPSAWSTSGVLQLPLGGNISASAGIGISGNAYFNSGWKYISTTGASQYVLSGNTHIWYNAPSGTAGNAITFTQAMTLDASGNLSLSNGTLSITKGTGSTTYREGITLEGVGTTTDHVSPCIAFSGQNINAAIWSSRAGGGYGGNLIFATQGGSIGNPTERARITSGGYFKASNNGGYAGSTGDYHEFRSNQAALSCLRIDTTSASLTTHIIEAITATTAGTGWAFHRMYSGNAADLEFTLRGDGNGYADGTWNNNGADYAEFFESATGDALTLGATVVLDGNKVREATDQDPVSAIMGVVRPKEPSKASMVVGNTAWNKWANKYLTDDFDRYIMEDHNVVEWTDEEGKLQSYESHNIPAGVTVPDDAVVKTHDDKGNKFQHYKLNPAWNPDAEYVNRENRPEWIIVGLVGQVKILKGQPVNDRWIKMRDVSATVEEWMIR